MRKMSFSLFLLAITPILFPAGPTYSEMYGGVDFPQGISSFADAVVQFTAGPNTVAPYNNPATALGAPNLGYDWVALGWGGSIVLKFTDNALTTSGSNANDLWVFEIGAAVEPTDVYISKNGTDWISVGTVAGSTRGVDIDSFIGTGGIVLWDKYTYVKLVDQNKQWSGYPYAGADIDAVGAISSTAPVPVPGDLNADMVVNLADAILALQILSGMPIGTVLKAAAVTGDGKIGLAEVIYILQQVAGLR